VYLPYKFRHPMFDIFFSGMICLHQVTWQYEYLHSVQFGSTILSTGDLSK